MKETKDGWKERKRERISGLMQTGQKEEEVLVDGGREENESVVESCVEECVIHQPLY